MEDDYRPLQSSGNNIFDLIYFNCDQEWVNSYVILEFVLKRRNYTDGDWITLPLGFMAIKIIGLEIPIKFYHDSPRQLMVPGYLEKSGEIASFMAITIDNFDVPINKENYNYWNDISTIISTNSLCGLNDIIPCLRSQKLKIPESIEKAHLGFEATK